MHSRTRMPNSTVSFRMKSKKIKIAIFGLGTVGGGTLELLQKNSALIEEKQKSYKYRNISWFHLFSLVRAELHLCKVLFLLVEELFEH